MRTRSLTLALTLLSLAALSSSALALDGFRDRRGLFFGLQLGGSGVQTDLDQSKRRLGLNARLRVGGGVSQQLTLDAEYGFNLHSDDPSTRQVHNWTVNAHYFPVKDYGFFLRLGGGMALAYDDFSPSSTMNAHSDSSLGLGGHAGLGYEFFVNSDLAVGLMADFQYQSFDEYALNTLNIGVIATWY